MTDKELERPKGRCWPWGHDWSRWAPNYQGSGYVSSIDTRKCLRCGRRQRRLR